MNFLKGIKDLRREANDAFDPIIRDARKAVETARAQKAAVDDPLDQAERILKDGLVAYDTAQERQRAEAQRLADEQARRDEETRVLEQAAAMEIEGTEFGDPALVREATALLEQPIAPPAAPLVAKATPKVVGVAIRSTWSAQVTDLLALVKFVAAHPSHLNLLTANAPALNAQARSLKGALRLPGVRAVEVRDVASSGRR